MISNDFTTAMERLCNILRKITRYKKPDLHQLLQIKCYVFDGKRRKPRYLYNTPFSIVIAKFNEHWLFEKFLVQLMMGLLVRVFFRFTMTGPSFNRCFTRKLTMIYMNFCE